MTHMKYDRMTSQSKTLLNVCCYFFILYTRVTRQQLNIFLLLFSICRISAGVCSHYWNLTLTYLRRYRVTNTRVMKKRRQISRDGDEEGQTVICRAS